MEPDKIAHIFKVLATESRVRIIRMLQKKRLCVGALSKGLDITRAAVSQHLRVLKDAGLVIPERRGYFIHYRLNPSRIDEVRNALLGLLEDVENEPFTECVERKKNNG